jgi:hypothetical protein
MPAQRVSLEARLLLAARGAPAFAQLDDAQRRAAIRAYLGQQHQGLAPEEVDRRRARAPDTFGAVYELHRRQSTFEADLAAWRSGSA